MIAPEPFFEPRGTPFSEFHRIRALTELGHQVDLVTYPFGSDVSMPGLRVFRCLRPPFVRRVGIGPSIAKLPLDFLLTFSVLRRALTNRYDAIHSHEEGGLIGVAVGALLGLPHLYDMHSSLPQQLGNFAFSRSRVIRRLFLAIERLMIRRSRVVIVICPSLEETVRGIDPDAHAILIENAPGSADADATPAEALALRRQLGLSASTPVVLYTGTFEAYQGLDLLFDAMAHVQASIPEARLLLAGGRPDQIDNARRRCRTAGIEDLVIFAGEHPSTEIPRYLLACDVLVSPRSRGTNTPLKIYQYLRSGKPIVATRLLTHTQVLSDDTAILTGTSPREFGDGVLAALTDSGRAESVGKRARELAETKYTYHSYLERTRQACAALFPTPTHYSYTVYADPATAQGFDERRFGGPIGELVAAEQARVLASFVGRTDHQSILDVGTGTGRAALLFARAGADVTGVDASEQMLAIARRRAADEHLAVRFVSGDAHTLAFGDRSFDVVISLRVLMHAADWRRSIAQLCRVADSLVVIDYPSAFSFAVIQSMIRRLTHALGARTEPYRVLSDGAVARELATSGFRVRAFHRQFVLPIALHKAMGSPRFSLWSNRLSARLGLLRLFGTPVTLVAERCEF
jgi:glycosyltransferase involved in cell wall biosynthesis/SAM-dependent methyltransferase